MNEVNLKEHIDEKMEDIRVNDQFKKTILKNIEAQGNDQKPAKRLNKKKIIITAAAAALIAAFPLTVGAETVGRTLSGWVTSTVNAQLADAMYAVNDSCTDQGIKVAVESAVNDSHSALVFVTVQDVEGKGRITEDTDLWDSYRFNIGGTSVGTATFDSYDPETQTARFYTQTTLRDNIANKTANFQLTRIMYGKTAIETYDTGIDLAALAQENPSTGGSAIKEIYGVGGTNLDDTTRQKPKKNQILTPDVMNISLNGGVDFVHITNIGFIDNKLHIQTKWEPSYDNHGDFNLCRKEFSDYASENLSNYLAATTGINSIDFATREDLERGADFPICKHIEYIFDVKPSELDNYKLIANFVKDGEVITGDWNVSFQMQHTESLKIDGGRHAKNVEITPLGVYVEGCTDKDEPKVDVTFQDGSTYTADYYSMVIVSWLFGTSTDYYAEGFTDQPIDNIAAVSINGEEIYRSIDN